MAVASGGVTLVGGVHEWSLDVGQASPGVTAFGDNWQTLLPGLREWTGTLSMRARSTDAGQDAVRNALLHNGTLAEFYFYAGVHYYHGSVLVTDATPGVAYDGAATLDFDVRGIGPLVFVIPPVTGSPMGLLLTLTVT